MAGASAADDDQAPNDAMAVPMAVIAGLSHNMVVGTIFGSFGVLIASVQDRMGVSLTLAGLGVPMVIIVSSLISPLIGTLARRVSLRLMMLVAALMTCAGFVVLAFATSYWLYLAAYFFLLGPAMAMGGSVGPTTLITRWFGRNRGLALGLAHLSIIVAIMPLLCFWVQKNYGTQATYLMVAVLVAALLVPFTLLIRDHPPGAGQGLASAFSDSPQATPVLLKSSQIMALPQFWMLALNNALVISSAVMLGTILVPMARSWNYTQGQGAVLASTMAFAGMAGSVLFGWVADRIGGARGLALIALNSGLLWALLLTGPGFPVLLVIIALLGLHGAGAVPNISRAMASVFGRDNFSSAFGLATALSLPFTVISVIGSSAVAERTHSFAVPIAVMALGLVVVALLGYLARPQR